MQDAVGVFEENLRLIEGQFQNVHQIQCFYDRWEEMLGGSIDEMVSCILGERKYSAV